MRPKLKIRLITDHAENVAIGNGHLDAGMQVPTQPFDMTALASKVDALLPLQAGRG